MDAVDHLAASASTRTALEVLDADAVRRWSEVSVAILEAHRREINSLNVFPVADRDTGTNMAVTLVAAHSALLAEPDADTAAAALHALAVGAALGAQGNSGAIVSQVLRGLAEAARAAEQFDGMVLAAGMARGAALARSAVVDPVEGTILTVAGAAAAAAVAGASLAEVVVAAVDAAVTALERTPDQMELLADAGVVDAGGRGLVLLLDALAQVVTGSAVAPESAALVKAPLPPDPSAPCAVGSAGHPFEVQYLLDTDEAAVGGLRAALSALGDSVVIAGTGGGTYNVHVHVADVGAAIEAGIEVGRPRQVSVVRFADQVDEAARPSAVVAFAPGGHLGHLFAAEGVQVLDNAGAGADAVCAALVAAGTHDVVVLPNSLDGEAIADAGAELARRHGLRVVVVPTSSVVQGLAAIAVHDPARRFDDDVVAMAEAAAATRSAEVVVAEQDAATPVGRYAAGDILGLIDGDVVQVGHSRLSVAFALLDRLLGIGAELITVVVGEGMTPSTGELMRSYVRERAPLAEVTVYTGGPARRPLLFGAE